MSSFRSVMQGFLLLAVGAVGILGFLAFSEKHDVPMMINFGVLTPIALLLGIWLIYRGIKFANVFNEEETARYEKETSCPPPDEP